MADTDNYFLSKQLKGNIKDKPKGDKKGILQNSYKKYEYKLNFNFNPEGRDFKLLKDSIPFDSTDLNYYINFCCKSIGKLDLNLQDNTTKMFGRSFITPSYMSFTSPLTIEFYDVNISTDPNDEPYMLSDFFTNWIEYAHGSTDYVNRKNYTRLAYLDAYAVDINVEATNQKYETFTNEVEYINGDNIKTNVLPNVDVYGADLILNKEVENLFKECSAYSSIQSGTTTIHGATNVFLYSVLLASSIIDIASVHSDKGNMIPQKVKDISNAQEAYGASRLPLVGGAGTVVAKAIQTTVSKDTNNDYKTLLKDYESNGYIQSNHTVKEIENFLDDENTLKDLESKSTYSVSLLHYLHNARQMEGFTEVSQNLKDAIESIEFVSLAGDKIGYKIPQPYSNEGTPYSEPKINSTISLADLWNHNVINRFMFDNEEEAKKTKQRLLDILNMLMLGKKTMDVKRIEENLMDIGNYLTGDVSENFVKKVVDKCREILQKSDYYDLNKKVYKAKNNNEEYASDAKADEIKTALNEKEAYTLINGNYYNENLIKELSQLISDRNRLKSDSQIKKYYGELSDIIADELNLSEPKAKEIKDVFERIANLNAKTTKENFVNIENLDIVKKVNVGVSAGYGSYEGVFISSRNAMIDAMEVFNVGIGLAIVASSIGTTSPYFQMSKNPHFNGWVSAINKVANAMFINGGQENYVNQNGKDPLMANWGGNNKNINSGEKASKAISDFIKSKHVLKSNEVFEMIKENSSDNKTENESPKNSIKYTLTYAYPSKINMTDTLSNDAIGQQSMPIIQVQFQFLDVKKTNS